ncbi:MAG: hypothetical protein M1833_007308 [Piccolia ochrophora]|nr:MAG: hypothetical protein M1833_007308 [Piccolia ochrophora]
MSGLEIVGVVASAAQLANYCIKISVAIPELYRSVRYASERIGPLTEQIRQLIVTTELVEQHRELQTANVHYHVEATLVEAIALDTILNQASQQYSQGSVRRYWKALSANKEKQIDQSFDKIEREKSALILSITTIHTGILCSIQGGVDFIGSSLPALAEPRTTRGDRSAVIPMPSNVPPSTNGAANPPGTNSAPKLRASAYPLNEQLQFRPPTHAYMPSTAVIRRPATPRPPNVQASIPSDTPPRRDKAYSQRQPTYPQPPTAPTTSATQHAYFDMTSDETARQMNGDVGAQNPAMASPRHQYVRSVARGNSRQINGNMHGDEAIRAFHS